MILVRSPLRITLGGGGTDLEPYCSTHGGFCLAAAIDKYVYVSVTKPFAPGIYLKYAEIEHVQRVRQVHHPIIRKALEVLSIAPQIEITTLADIPAGTGLGSSSSFTTALLQALFVYKHQHIATKELAELAVNIERSVGTTGRQDQFMAAYGGIGVLTFDQYTSQYNHLLRLSPDDERALNDRLLLFYTSTTHDASKTLADQGSRTRNLDSIKRIGRETRQVLEARCAWGARLGELLNYQWECKEERCPSDVAVYHLRNRALSWASGVKLIGAGKGGFLLCDTETPTQLRHAMAVAGAMEVRYGWDWEGCKVLLS